MRRPRVVAGRAGRARRHGAEAEAAVDASEPVTTTQAAVRSPFKRAGKVATTPFVQRHVPRTAPTPRADDGPTREPAPATTGTDDRRPHDHRHDRRLVGHERERLAGADDGSPRREDEQPKTTTGAADDRDDTYHVSLRFGSTAASSEDRGRRPAHAAAVGRPTRSSSSSAS